MRADARRNRQRLVAAAMELFVEQGVDVALDAVARRADVGIGTLYRHFPDRHALAGTVALESFATLRRLASDETAPGSAPGGLQRFLVRVAQLRVGVLLSSLYPLLTARTPDGELVAAFEEVTEEIDALVARARADGDLREDVTADDVMLLLALLTQPLQGASDEYIAAMTPRLLHLVLEGLQPSEVATPPPPAPPAPAEPGATSRPWTED